MPRYVPRYGPMCGLIGAGASALFAPASPGQVTVLTSQAFVEGTTSFDQRTEVVAGSDFAAFTGLVDLATEFPLQDGGIGINRALAGIDCDIDPSRIRLSGDLAGAGGLALGLPDPVDGNGLLYVLVFFEVTADTPFMLSALPRPSENPDDRFKLSLQQVDGPQVFLLEDTDPAQPVLESGLLAPGMYEFEVEVELTVEGPEQFREFATTLALPGPGTGGAAALMAGFIAARGRRRRSGY